MNGGDRKSKKRSKRERKLMPTGETRLGQRWGTGEGSLHRVRTTQFILSSSSE
jgi:hypothetical protein